MKFTGLFQKKMYLLIKRHRMSSIRSVLDKESKTLLDIGCQDHRFHDMVKSSYRTVLADIAPKNEMIKKEDVQNLSFKDDEFDIVVCQEVLEHVHDPIKAIHELRRVARNQLVVTVPYEPFFTLFRLLFWQREHLWAITPEVLEFYLGKPEHSSRIFFRRYYLGVWGRKQLKKKNQVNTR